MIEAKYDVPDMNCDHCKSAIEDSLNEISGVENALADPDTKVVEVEYDENQVDEERITSAIEDAGYTIAA